MRRRPLLLAPLLALAGSPSARAAPSGVIILTDGHVAQYREALDAAREVLKDAAVVDVNESDAATRAAAAAVILAIGQRAAQMAQTDNAQAVIVTCMVFGRAVAASRRITGLKMEVSPDTQLAYFRRVYSGCKRLGIIYQTKVSGDYLAEAQKVASGLGLSLVPRAVTDALQVRSTLSEMVGAIDALWLLPDPQLINADMLNFLLVFTLERKLPLFGFLESFTKVGALAAVAPDYKGIGQRAARLAAELAARPPESRQPVPPMAESPGTFSLNLKTARQLGIEIPADVVAAANQVYR
jgi:putative ABC transport system substrate-binding protein